MTIKSRKQRIQEQKAAEDKKRNQKFTSGVLATGIGTTAFFGNMQMVEACDCVENYTIESGDTLYSIAKNYKVTVDQLKSKNGFESDRIYAGQDIIVPFLDEKGNLPIVGEPMEEGEIVHYIQNGDTLWSLSRKYGVSIEKLMKDNNLQSTILIEGRLLTVNTGVEIFNLSLNIFLQKKQKKWCKHLLTHIQYSLVIPFIL
ncbi:LysM peptidoglycan-binding domain-containing protein [Niallia sp. 01092]|uniref:LysM peptidoglycan-binding domain-containing protein n=1 Tax=unclassified Niallia TaxID=2837522 RepID=UPI003FD1C3BE